MEDELRKVCVIAAAGQLDMHETQGGDSSSEPSQRNKSDIRRPAWSSVSSLESRDGMATEGDAAPDRFGRYEIAKVLGQGVFGTVYLAEDTELKRMVAVKVPTGRQLLRPEDVQRYMAEARIVASLDHPSIVPVYDVGQTDDGLCFVVSKYIEGSDLRQLISATRIAPAGSGAGGDNRRCPAFCTPATFGAPRCQTG